MYSVHVQLCTKNDMETIQCTYTVQSVHVFTVHFIIQHMYNNEVVNHDYIIDLELLIEYVTMSLTEQSNIYVTAIAACLYGVWSATGSYYICPYKVEIIRRLEFLISKTLIILYTHTYHRQRDLM